MAVNPGLGQGFLPPNPLFDSFATQVFGASRFAASSVDLPNLIFASSGQPLPIYGIRNYNPFTPTPLLAGFNGGFAGNPILAALGLGGQIA